MKTQILDLRVFKDRELNFRRSKTSFYGRFFSFLGKNFPRSYRFCGEFVLFCQGGKQASLNVVWNFLFFLYKNLSVYRGNLFRIYSQWPSRRRRNSMSIDSTRPRSLINELSNRLMRLIISDPNMAEPNPSTTRPPVMPEVISNNTAFITNVNKPRVNTLIGRVRINRIGRKKALRIPSTRAAIRAVP